MQAPDARCPVADEKNAHQHYRQREVAFPTMGFEQKAREKAKRMVEERRGEDNCRESWARVHVSSLVVDRETHLPSLEDAGAARELDELDEAQCAYLKAYG